VAVGRELRRLQPPRIDDPDGQAQVMRTGEPLVISEVTPEQLDEAAHDERHRALLDAVGICSLMIVPMRTSTRTLGTLTFVASSPTRAFDEADVAFAEELGRRAAVALEHAWLYGERSHIAATLQHSLLPADPPDLPGWRIATLYRPAGDGIEAGGDFYDIVRTDRGWMAFVGDVCGKGAEAAALTALCRYTLRSAAKLGLAAQAALAHLNQALIDADGLLLCTVVALEFDAAGHCAVANAGHPRALLVRDGEPMPIERAGPMLGIDAEDHWPREALVLGPHDTFVLYTDGVLDAANGRGERFGEARTEAAVAGAGLTAEGRLRALVAQIEAFQTGAQRDDAAALVVERTATRSAPAVTAGS
jgi:serine phosphatase RsbU (regulator of sigma subunit)